MKKNIQIGTPPGYVKLLFYKLVDRVCRKQGISKVFESNYGIKVINSLPPTFSYTVLKKEDVRPEQLFLDIDVMKDSFTLLDTNIINSPHYKLMCVLNNNENPENTEYCKRFAAGTLDGRFAARVNSLTYQRLIGTFQKRKKQIIESTYDPVIVYELDDKYYIADGKHRAALAILLNGVVKCNVISNDYLLDSYTFWLYRMMKRNETEYKKNITFLEKKYRRIEE